MLFTCEKCHYIYDNILNRDYCPDCGSKKIHPATASETVKFIEGNSEENNNQLNDKLLNAFLDQRLKLVEKEVLRQESDSAAKQINSIYQKLRSAGIPQELIQELSSSIAQKERLSIRNAYRSALMDCQNIRNDTVFLSKKDDILSGIQKGYHLTIL